jgi:ubiquinone/menaquinone biosynthesis C-methylase UbiE
MTILYALFGLIMGAILLRLAAGAARRRRRFPIPPAMVGLIDNPIRRAMQPPEKMITRFGIRPGMRVLEIGPGKGSYTLAAARRVGNSGSVVAIDIERQIIERLRQRAEQEGVGNLEARLGDVHALNFEEGVFDAAFLMAVIGEIPSPERAMREFHRVLKPGGTLAFCEMLPDPDYPLPRTLMRLANEAGLQLKERSGNFWIYSMLFEKPQFPGSE